MAFCAAEAATTIPVSSVKQAAAAAAGALSIVLRYWNYVQIIDQSVPTLQSTTIIVEMIWKEKIRNKSQ